MTGRAHHLVIPRSVAQLTPGEPIYAERDDFIVGSTWMATSGQAVLMATAGPLVLVFGDGRRPRRLQVEM